MQSIQATIQIPPELVLIPRVEFEKLKNDAEEAPVLWTLSDLVEKERIGGETVVTQLLNYAEFRKELEHKIVLYPVSNRSPYIIHARLMKDWLDKNFERINRKRELWRVK